jgi:hypothetical protein
LAEDLLGYERAFDLRPGTILKNVADIIQAAGRAKRQPVKKGA